MEKSTLYGVGSRDLPPGMSASSSVVLTSPGRRNRAPVSAIWLLHGGNMKRDMKKQKTALRVNKETIRQVGEAELAEVAGGNDTIGAITRQPTRCLACQV
jgi:hypothetical protein